MKRVKRKRTSLLPDDNLIEREFYRKHIEARNKEWIEEHIEKNIRKAFGGDPYESGQRDSRNGENIQWGDSWVKEMKRLYPMQWKQYCKGHDDWTSKHDQN